MNKVAGRNQTDSTRRTWENGAVTPRDLSRLKEKLLSLQAEILSEGDLAFEPTRKDAAQVGGDEDEQPLAEMSQIIASKRNRARTEVLGRVRAALVRMEEAPDDFGQCADCGELIGRRLEAMPYVDLCIECQQERDGGPRSASGRRRHLTDFT
jgi:DnaK suppressor protein